MNYRSRLTSRATHAIAVAVLSAVAGCDTFTTVGGRVVDANGQAGVGATVIANKGEDQRDVFRTDSLGRFSTGFSGGFRSPDALVQACRGDLVSPVVAVPDGAHVDTITLELRRRPGQKTLPAGEGDKTTCN